MMQKLREIIDWLRMVALSVFCGYVVYFLICTAYPIVITEFIHPHVIPPEVKAGDVAYYRNHFIRKYACFGEVARIITNDKGMQVGGDVKFLVSDVGEHDVSTPIEIPKWLPEGKYHIQFYHRWFLSRPFLPVRIVEKVIESNDFMVVK